MQGQHQSSIKERNITKLSTYSKQQYQKHVKLIQPVNKQPVNKHRQLATPLPQPPRARSALQQRQDQVLQKAEHEQDRWPKQMGTRSSISSLPPDTSVMEMQTYDEPPVFSATQPLARDLTNHFLHSTINT